MDNLTKLQDLLIKMSMQGTVRLTVGAMNKQAQLTYFVQPGLREEIRGGNLQEIFQELRESVESGEVP